MGQARFVPPKILTSRVGSFFFLANVQFFIYSDSELAELNLGVYLPGRPAKAASRQSLMMRCAAGANAYRMVILVFECVMPSALIC